VITALWTGICTFLSGYCPDAALLCSGGKLPGASPDSIVDWASSLGRFLCFVKGDVRIYLFIHTLTEAFKAYAGRDVRISTNHVAGKMLASAKL
jgi:hypothetical protein